MKTNIETAQQILGEASDAIGANLQVHGDTAKSFSMIAQLWTTYLNHVMMVRKSATLTAHDVPMMMGMVKQARATYGASRDNFVDQAGYAALAGMLDPSGQPIKDNAKEGNYDDSSAI